MRLFLSLDGPALAHVNFKALGVLHHQSELKIRDVKDIFTRVKKKPAEEIIGSLARGAVQHWKVLSLAPAPE